MQLAAVTEKFRKEKKNNFNYLHVTQNNEIKKKGINVM